MAAFGTLSDRLTATFRNLRTKGKLTPADVDGTVRDLKVVGLPDPQLKALNDGKYLEQFKGHATEDFEVTIGKKGRIKSRGIFYSHVRYPGPTPLRKTFERIVRSMRYNASFMDVAFFITQHPDLAAEDRLAKIEPVSGPEAFIKNRKAEAEDPFDKKQILQTLKPDPPKSE